MLIYYQEGICSTRMITIRSARKQYCSINRNTHTKERKDKGTKWLAKRGSSLLADHSFLFSRKKRQKEQKHQLRGFFSLIDFIWRKSPVDCITLHTMQSRTSRKQGTVFSLDNGKKPWVIAFVITYILHFLIIDNCSFLASRASCSWNITKTRHGFSFDLGPSKSSKSVPISIAVLHFV